MQIPVVAYAEAPLIFQPLYEPNDPLLSSQWYLEKVDAENAWDISTGSSEIRVAIIDVTDGSTYDISYHEDFQLPGGGNKFVGGDILNGADHPRWVAGIVGAVTNNLTPTGIASLGWNVSLLNYTYPDGTAEENLPDLISRAWDPEEGNADILNFSITILGKCNNKDCPIWSDDVAVEINQARLAGVIMVAAAGNGVYPGCNPPCQGATLPFDSYPAKYNGVIGVSATNQTDDFVENFNYGSFVDISAPGTNILTTGAGYSQYTGGLSGTSFSSPLVSALASLIIAVDDFSSPEVEDIIKQTADKVDYIQYPYVNGWNDHLGYGRINAFQAVLLAAAYANKSSLQTATGYNNGRRLVRDGTGNYHLVFSSGGEIFYHKTTDGGSTWQTPIKLSYVEGNNNYPSISQSGNRIYVTWQRNLGSNNYDIYFSESTNSGSSWSNKYVLSSETVSSDPLPVIHSVSNYTLIVFRYGSGIKSYWTYYDVPDQYSWIMRTVGFNTSNSPTITHAINSPVTYFPLAIANSSDNHIYYYYYDTQSTYWNGGPNNLSIIVPGSGVHRTPTITNIPSNPQIHVAWKKLIGDGSSIYDHLVIHRRAKTYNSWPNEWFGTYYNSQEYPSITGLATNKVDLLYQTPPQFGSPYVYKMRFGGQYWGSPVSIANNARYPSVSSGYTTSKYVWTSGSTSPYTVMLSSETLNKETEVDPKDYYTRSIALLDSSGSYIEIKVHNIAFEFADGSIQKLNYEIAGLDSFDMTIQNCYDSLATTLLSVAPLSARKMIFDISVSGVGINNLFGNTSYIPVSMKLFNNQNVTLRSIQNNFNVLNGTLQEIRRTFTIPLTGLGIVPGVTKLRANLKLLNLNPAIGVFPSLGHIFDYTSLVENLKASVTEDNMISSTVEEPFIQNYPNPFNPITQIKYSIVKDGLVTLKVYDILGREITTLVNEEKQDGTYTVQFDAGNLCSGIYFYSITTRDYNQTKKMILLR
jgi:hypothetical protein